MAGPAQLHICDVSVSYGRTQALKHVSCEFGAGVTGVLGPNGAGKSTLFKVLTGVLRPTEGSVERDGVVLDGGKAWQDHLARLGYLPQDPGWFEGFTVTELCLYMAGLRGVPRQRRAEDTARAIAAVRLEKQKDTRLKALSGGMRRRAFLAQAIVHDPPVLILDEPTSGLDPVQRLHVRELLAEIGRDRAILVSTHLVEDVAHIASTVIVLDQGVVVWRGAPKELTRQAARRSSDQELASLYERGFLAVLSSEDES